jgi:hypothetical protein
MAMRAASSSLTRSTLVMSTVPSGTSPAQPGGTLIASRFAALTGKGQPARFVQPVVVLDRALPNHTSNLQILRLSANPINDPHDPLLTRCFPCLDPVIGCNATATGRCPPCSRRPGMVDEHHIDHLAQSRLPRDDAVSFILGQDAQRSPPAHKQLFPACLFTIAVGGSPSWHCCRAR